MFAISSGVLLGHLLAHSSSVLLQIMGPPRHTLPPPLVLSLGCPWCARDGGRRADAHEISSKSRTIGIARPREREVWGARKDLSFQLSGHNPSATERTQPNGGRPLTITPGPVCRDGPACRERRARLGQGRRRGLGRTGRSEPRQGGRVHRASDRFAGCARPPVGGCTAESDRAGCACAQVQLCMLVFCLLFALISLIALSWRKYGAIIIRSRHDPNWKVREESPSMGPRSPNKKKD